MDKSRPRLTLSVPRLGAAPAIGLIVFGTVIPVIVLLLKTFDRHDLTSVWGRPGVAGALWFSMWQATLSMFCTIATALIPTWAISRHRFPGRKTIMVIMTVPFVLPTVVVGAAFLALLPTSMERSVWAIILAHVFFNISIVIRTVSPVWASIDEHLLDAARTLGASPWRVWRHIVLPLIRSSLVSAAALVFLMSATSYGVVRILGGPSRSTLDVEIYRRAVQVGDISGATVLALAQTLVIILGLVILTRRSSTQLQTMRSNSVNFKPQASLITTFWAWLSAAMMLIPIAALILASVHSKSGWSISGWRLVLGLDQSTRVDISVAHSLRTSLLLAALACAIAVPIGIGAARALAYSRRGPLGLLLAIPLGTSGVIVGFGILVTYNQGPFDFRSQWWLIGVVHAVVALPFVVRSTLPLMEAIPHGLDDAAATLGASTTQRWLFIHLPLMRPAVATALAFSCAMSLGEFGATSFLTRYDTETLPITVGKLLGRTGALAYSAGMAVATLLLFVTAAIIISVDRSARL